MLIDSPGMIDSPASVRPRASERDALSALSLTPASHLGERGYDFLGVTRWLAEHADVVLLFFDPDKPGTTGETLECLTQSLGGLEHKLHLVMSKVDQFEHIHDFARAYGSLCWNLAKVIPRKDLPRIYTMYLPSSFLNASKGAAAAAAATAVEIPPTAAVPTAAALTSAAPTAVEPTSKLALALEELEKTRAEVLHEVLRAPERRLDNTITRAHDSAALLRMHARVMETARADYSTLRLRWAVLSTGVFVLPVSISATLLAYDEITVAIGGGIAAGGAFAAALGAVQAFMSLRARRDFLTRDAGLNQCFTQSHVVEVTERDEFALALWRRVRPQASAALKTLGLQNAPWQSYVSSAEMVALDALIDERVPALRRQAGQFRCAPNIRKQPDDGESIGSTGRL